MPIDAQHAVFETDLALPGKRRGKVRDTYVLPEAASGGADAILMVATDRLSAFDVVLPTPIPGKGRVLTELAAFWLGMIAKQGQGPTHLISIDDRLVPDSALTDTTGRRDLSGRVTIGQRCAVIPVECVVRGYLEGSGLTDYRKTGSVCGVALPAGLGQCDQLPEPIFTPATKAETGHDENIGFEAACQHAAEFGGRPLIEKLRDRSIAIYKMASEHARTRGIILADTKFEFGLPLLANGSPDVKATPVLIDEALTPDSSRFWPADRYEPGRAQTSYDKQFVREHLQSLVDTDQWNKTSPGPVLPEQVVRGTIARYTEALERLVEGT
ncbi:MAG: phosphoribosylaminoimidazolesuccinocarboxamide synthase [Phycisphaerales bacterium]